MNNLINNIALLKEAHDNVYGVNDLSDSELSSFIERFVYLLDKKREHGECLTVEESVYFILNYKAYNSMCGCLGPQNGEPYCPCTMRSKCEDHKLQIALEFVKTEFAKSLRKRVNNQT